MGDILPGMTTALDLPLSDRVNSIKPSSTLAVGMKAREMRSAGIEVLSFAAGEPDFKTPEAVCKAAKAAIDAGDHHYAPVPGDPATRGVIAEKLSTENGIPDVTPDHIVISSGGKQSLYLIFQALLDPAGGGANDRTAGREVVLPVPAWVSYRPQIEMAGGRVVEVETTGAGDFKMSAEQLEAAITARTRAVVLNSPSNPCGTMYSEGELRDIAGVIERAASSLAPDLVVVTDEMYEKLIFGGIEHFSIGSIPAVAERVITVNGLSKSYAMTGWRVGYLGGSGGFGKVLAGACKKLQSQLNTAIPSFILPAVRAAITECDADVERMRLAFAERAEVMHAGLTAIEGVECPKPTGAFYAFCDISSAFGKTSGGGKAIGNAVEFAAALLEEHHVAVVPGDDFGGVGRNCVRMTFATDPATINEGVSRLGAFVGSLRSSDGGT